MNIRLPKVQPAQLEPPTHCRLSDLKDRRKPIRDTRHVQVIARRYRCLKCQRTFRAYPSGVSSAQQSDTLIGLSILLYVFGLSHQGVSDLLDSLGFFLSKTTVYLNVQAAGRRAIQLRRQWVAQRACQVKVLGIDCTHVKRAGQDIIVAVAMAVLTDSNPPQATLLPWHRPLPQTPPLGPETYGVEGRDRGAGQVQHAQTRRVFSTA